jgi:uncharacterized protein (DUF2141 family)
MKALLLLLFIYIIPMKKENTHTLTIGFDKIKEEHVGKKIYIGFWKNNPKGFPKDGTIDFGEMIEINSKSPKLNIKLEAGIYAVSAFIDLNGNGKLDKNFFGIPKEPYCFSNNFKPALSAPDFKDCSFELKHNESITLKMLY